MRNIRDYGAVGDGAALDTRAIQNAIDDGGMVYIPDGIYRTGTLYLKSDGGLHLAPGAVLLASHDREDYNADDFCPQNDVFTSEHVTGAHLITAIEQENITIEGHGKIEGEGHFWMNESNPIPYAPDEYAPNDERPGQMIFLCECKNVHVTDVNILNGPYWHLFFHGCEDVFVRGVTIRGDRPRWTNDGIDIDCCKRVTVEGCVIDVGDDAIAIRAYHKPLLHSDGVCENVTITNCVIRADRDYGMRIGVGAGIIRNVAISNMDIEAPNCGGIGMMGCWSPESKYATTVENILFSNLNIRAKRPLEIYVSCFDDSPLPNPCHIRDLSFSSLTLFPTERCVLRGRPDNKLTGVTIENVLVTPPENHDGNLFALRNCEDLAINGLRVAGKKRSDAWKCVFTDKCDDITINGNEIS